MCVSLSVLRAYIFLVSMVSLHLILVKKIKKGILASQRAGRSHGFEKTSFRFPFPPRPARPFFRIIHVILLFLLVDLVASSRPSVLGTWCCCGVEIVGGHCSILVEEYYRWCGADGYRNIVWECRRSGWSNCQTKSRGRIYIYIL